MITLGLVAIGSILSSTSSLPTDLISDSTFFFFFSIGFEQGEPVDSNAGDKAEVVAVDSSLESGPRDENARSFPFPFPFE